MELKGFLKRALPFFLTFSLVLLVASFFVTIAAPNFTKFKRSGNHRCRDSYRLRMENESIRRENDMLKRRLANEEIKTVYVKPTFDSDLAVPPPPPLPPAPPAMRR